MIFRWGVLLVLFDLCCSLVICEFLFPPLLHKFSMEHLLHFMLWLLHLAKWWVGGFVPSLALFLFTLPPTTEQKQSFKATPSALGGWGLRTIPNLCWKRGVTAQLSRRCVTCLFTILHSSISLFNFLMFTLFGARRNPSMYRGDYIYFTGSQIYAKPDLVPFVGSSWDNTQK